MRNKNKVIATAAGLIILLLLSSFVAGTQYQKDAPSAPLVDKQPTIANNNGSLVSYIGNRTNTIRILYMGTASEEFTKEQELRYTENMRRIIQAIPKNIPTVETLSRVEIDEVVFYKDFAKIRWYKDLVIEDFEKDNIPYKGQF